MSGDQPEGADKLTLRIAPSGEVQPLVHATAYGDPSGDRAGQLAAVRGERASTAPGDQHKDVVIVGDASSSAKPEPGRDARWKTMTPNESIEAAASPSQKWNQKDSPVPPIGQILASDTGNDPTMVKAVQDALKAQAGGDKTRLGDLIVKQVGEAGGDSEAARKLVEKAFTEQKAMQNDFALESLARMAGPGGKGTASFDELARSNPELAAQIKQWAAAESNDKSPYAMNKDLKTFEKDLADVSKQVGAMITPEERQKFPDADQKVQEKALSIMLANPDPIKRLLAIEKLRRQVIESSPDN